MGNYIERERVVDLLHLHGDELVLDVGCGRGLVLNAVAKRLKSGKAIGIDIWSKRDVSGNDPSETRKNAEIEGVAERVEIRDGDARSMPFEDNFFDAVTSSLVLHNISNREERRQSVREIYRVLKPGGRFAVLDLQHTNEYAYEFRQCGAVDVEIQGPHFTMFPPVRIVTGRKVTMSG
ncbi:class I SAM-dependent methyltransferase [Alicyclobacillus kakegawensis]|uniref:class I SAM-dependent methyltransferase n=1 Tax=Alicyclobacillus kakegawensis TaxID=392012 RepID=UPI001C3F26EE|nr:class I SAM-dependent methyltransferase [Alicyclobacillus kakegawensis]